MSSGGNIRQRNIDIADELYNAFKSVAAKRGKRLYAAFADAMELWIRSDESGEGVVMPVGFELSEEERDAALATVALLRDKNDVAVEMLDAMLRRYRGKLKVAENRKKRA